MLSISFFWLVLHDIYIILTLWLHDLHYVRCIEIIVFPFNFLFAPLWKKYYLQKSYKFSIKPKQFARSLFRSLLHYHPFHICGWKIDHLSSQHPRYMKPPQPNKHHNTGHKAEDKRWSMISKFWYSKDNSMKWLILANTVHSALLV